MAASKNCPSIELLTRLDAFFAARGKIEGSLCVGLSGGRDSVVLLHALTRLALPGSLAALHVHHGLSPHADAWAAHCRQLCAALGVELSVARVEVKCNSGLGLEAAARQERYRVFAESDADVLLLAHHQGDQAETVLFNLLRGCGVTGAAAMPAERSLGKLRLWRPLLDVAPTELDAYARYYALSWVEDESNADTSLTRNFLRHAVLPQIGQRFAGAQHSLAQAAGHFAEAEALLGELALIDWQNSAQGKGLLMAVVRRLSPQRLKNLLRWRLRLLGWQVPVATRLDEFARQLHSAGLDRHPSLTLPDGEMRVKNGLLHWVEGDENEIL
ncbi:MAG: PP-loop [Proteobacteria bacterium]|nr:PP-loop [Pseudomonadota bacterium]